MFLRPERGEGFIDQLHKERPELRRSILSRRLLAVLIGALVLLLRFVVGAPDGVVWGVALGVGVPAWVALEVVLHRRRKREQHGPDSAET